MEASLQDCWQMNPSNRAVRLHSLPHRQWFLVIFGSCVSNEKIVSKINSKSHTAMNRKNHRR